MVNIIPSSISSQFKSLGTEASGTPKTNTLAVNDQTSLKDLQSFLSRAGSSDQVRGHMVNGSLVLYTRGDVKADPTSTSGKIRKGLSDTFQFSSERKRDLGKAGIEKIFSQHIGAEKVATSNVMAAINQGVKSTVKVGSMVILAEIARARPMDQLQPRNAGPSLSDLRMTKDEMADAMKQAGKLLKSGDMDGAAKLLGNELARAFEQTNPDGTQRDAFALSLGKAFKQEINELAEKSSLKVPPPPNPDAPSFADKVYAAVGSQVGQAKVNDSGELVVGDKTYVKGENLGKGGNGTVDLYVNKNDPSDRLAFKVVNAGGERDMAQVKMLVEIENHRQAFTNDNDNVVPYRAGVQLPNGMFGVAMDIAQLGDMESAINVLNEAEKKGAISPKESMAARLTLIQDCFKGIEAMNEAGIVHRDIKPGNMFIFGGGVAKIADLGDLRQVANYNIFDSEGQTPAFLAPERFLQVKNETALEDTFKGMKVIKLRYDLKKEDDFAPLKGGENPMRAAMRDTFAQQLPGLGLEARKNLVSDVLNTMKQDMATANNVVDPLKRDAFALGLTAYQVGQGEEAFSGWDRSDNFDKVPNAVLSQVASNKFSTVGITDPALISAIDELMKLTDGLTTPNMANRIDVSTALQSPAFNLEGVGSQQTRTMIDTLLRQNKKLDENYMPL